MSRRAFQIVVGLLWTGVYLGLGQGIAEAVDWKELRADHFIVYFEQDEEFARQVAHKAEAYYKKIADDLGYARYSNFWQWEKRAKIYIHSSEESFKQLTGQPGWSHGMADYKKKEIHAVRRADQFLDGVLPHEIAHLIFRDFVGLEGQIPLWMDEGVAQWEEPAKRAQSKKIARYLVATGKDYHTYDLMRTDIRSEPDAEKVQYFYMQAVSLVDYLIQTYGPAAFTEFCRGLRDGKKFEDALRGAFPESVATIADLDSRWRDFARADIT